MARANPHEIMQQALNRLQLQHAASTSPEEEVQQVQSFLFTNGQHTVPNSVASALQLWPSWVLHYVTTPELRSGGDMYNATLPSCPTLSICTACNDYLHPCSYKCLQAAHIALEAAPLQHVVPLGRALAQQRARNRCGCRAHHLLHCTCVMLPVACSSRPPCQCMHNLAPVIPGVSHARGAALQVP